jgi:uncharacterized membrane protein (UPF0127 family)
MRFGQLTSGLLLLAACAETSAALPSETIVIDTRHGQAKFKVEIAADLASQERGLMFRKAMDPDAGMLFVFARPQFVSFWMKDTYIPLDIVFVRADGVISSIKSNASPMSTSRIPSDEAVVVVIELNSGRTHDLDIEPGNRVHASMLTTPTHH